MLSSSSTPTVADACAFTCTSRPDTDAVLVVPEGELDLATAPLLDAELRQARDAGCEKLVVDLRGLNFIDSSGVHLLLRWAAWAARHDRAFSLIPGSKRVQMVFAMTGVLDLLAFDRVSSARGRVVHT